VSLSETPNTPVAVEPKLNGKKTSEESVQEPKANVVLTYFNGTGRAELARFVRTSSDHNAVTARHISFRLIMVNAGIEFEDRRIGSDEWSEMKPGTPFCQVPC
jgi:hypothetical protein